MDALLAQCADYISADAPLLFSIMLAGLVGSVSHCSVMCSPLIAAQMLDLDARKRPQWNIGYYHVGRITTYALLGAVAVSMSQWLFGGQLEQVAKILLLIAGILFITSALLPQKTHSCCSESTQNVQKQLNRLPFTALIFYSRGLLMGMMPCGMVVAVLLAVATLQSPAIAAFSMVAFGLTTLPALQLTGYGALRLGKRFPQYSASIGRSIMALNGLFLCIIGLNIINLH